MFFPQRNGRHGLVQQQQQRNKTIFFFIFFDFHSFFDSLTVCLCCSCCCLVILSQAIAAGQTALRLALLPATERTSARGTRDLCQAGETQHTIPHTHAHQKKKKSLFFYLLFIHDDLANMVSISLIFPFLCWPAFPCVCEYHVKDALTYLLASRERERERERQCEPKGTTMWNKNFIIGETNQRTWKTNWSLPMSTGFFFLFHRVPRAVCVHRWCIYLVNDAMPDGNPGSLCFSLAYSRNLFSMYINNIDTQHIHCPVHIYVPKADGHTKGRRPVEKEFTFALKKKIFFIFYFLFSCRLRKW